MKKIFSYTNFRTLLKDYYEQQKSSGGYTYRDFSLQAGMNSSSWLLHLIKGTKNLSGQTALKVAKVLKLKKKETEYFLLMVKFTQAKTSDEKNEYYKEMIALKRRLKVIKITEEQYQYYTRWYHPVIRSLVSKVDFGNDFSVLAKALLPPITPAEAKKSVSLLKKLGFIKQLEDGKWIQINSVLSTGDEVTSLNVVNYHKQVSKLAEDAFDRCSKELRDISALTLGINKDDVRKIKAKIQEFRKEIMAIAGNSVNDDRVYQLNFQFFPVSRCEEHEV
jgi:uncharacterized protein (TIGR02147 family)